MAKWLDFRLRPRPVDRKTDIYEVWNKDGKSYLGTVSWYAVWRCYSFFPSGNRNLVFERTCLLDIVDFIDQLMEERKQSKPT